MKTADIKSLTVEELKDKIAVEQESLGKLKFAHAISPVENPSQLKTARRLIARLKTELNARN